MAQEGWTGCIPPAAFRTDPPYQPLCDHTAERAGKQIRLNAKIPQGRDGARRINCMQSTKQLLPGECGAHGHSRGFDIADFPNHALVQACTLTSEERQ